MIAQVPDYGASLGRFIAAQSAVSALGDEWDAVAVSVQPRPNSLRQTWRPLTRL